LQWVQKNLSSIGCEKRLQFAQKNLVSLISEELNDDKRFICAIIFHISKLYKIIDYTKIKFARKDKKDWIFNYFKE
jgi:hypothetical protein